jgi:putative flippase GtrA
VATGIDFAVVVALVQGMAINASTATLVGALVGAITNFSMNRIVTFRNGDAIAPQATRYAVVSGSSALLNAGGVALLAFHPALDYRIAWWLVRGVVWLGWNFPMQRSWVFAPPEERHAA